MLNGWPRVAVIGGSIGGLTAALVLRDLGCEVEIFERSTTTLQDRGAGIGLHPMTIRYFTRHGTFEEAKIALTLPWVRFLTRDGRTEYEEKMNYQFSSWTAIYRTLLKHFGEDRYRLGREVTGFVQDDEGVSIEFASAPPVRVEMLVCADGISSTARAILQPKATPRYAGYVAWRGTVPESVLSKETFEDLRDAITYFLTPSGHILVYPIPGPDGELAPGQRLINFVWYHNYAEGPEVDDLMTDRDGQLRSVSLPPGSVRSEYVHWMRTYAESHMPPPIAEVVVKVDKPFIQAIFDIEVERMAFGRIGLIGDGAFAIRPHAAAGTAKACADAWTLQESLRDSGGDVVEALRLWEPGQLALGRQLLERTRAMGDGSQFHHNWVPGDPALRFGLYGPGE